MYSKGTGTFNNSRGTIAYFAQMLYRISCPLSDKGTGPSTKEPLLQSGSFYLIHTLFDHTPIRERVK